MTKREDLMYLSAIRMESLTSWPALSWKLVRNMTIMSMKNIPSTRLSTTWYALVDAHFGRNARSRGMIKLFYIAKSSTRKSHFPLKGCLNGIMRFWSSRSLLMRSALDPAICELNLSQNEAPCENWDRTASSSRPAHFSCFISSYILATALTAFIFEIADAQWSLTIK